MWVDSVWLTVWYEMCFYVSTDEVTCFKRSNPNKRQRHGQHYVVQETNLKSTFLRSYLWYKQSSTYTGKLTNTSFCGIIKFPTSSLLIMFSS